MTTRGFHNAHALLSVSLWQILPIPIFRTMSDIGHLLIADTIISAAVIPTYSFIFFNVFFITLVSFLFLNDSV